MPSSIDFTSDVLGLLLIKAHIFSNVETFDFCREWRRASFFFFFISFFFKCAFEPDFNESARQQVSKKQLKNIQWYHTEKKVKLGRNCFQTSWPTVLKTENRANYEISLVLFIIAERRNNFTPWDFPFFFFFFSINTVKDHTHVI